MKSSTIHWLAGFLEGEGSFFCTGGKSLTLSATSTDEDVIVKAASILGRNVNGPYPNGFDKLGTAHKEKYQVTACGTVAAAWMMTLYPLMSARRRAKIKESLSVWRQQPVTRKLRTVCPSGHSLFGENLYVNKRGERSCKTCFSRAGRQARMLAKINGALPAQACQ